MGRDTENEYGCFRCGTVRPVVDLNPDTGNVTCATCGEAAIVTFRQAMDMLNGYYVQHKDMVIDSMNYDEYYPELTFQQDDEE